MSKVSIVIPEQFEWETEEVPTPSGSAEYLIPFLKSQVTVDPPLAPLIKGGWGDRYVTPVYRNGIIN